ncbi:MAG: helix-turn-helix transcriptional regulator, partial [Clostridia bacterium]|nr:helix-turn-helix transcriptional regulator [Clostridia bacterium]
MILADKIIDLRKKQGWSQEELAEQLGVSRQSVSKWESGMSVPDLNKIIAMSELFGVSTDYLVKDTLEEPTPSETEARDTAAPARTVTAEEANDDRAAVEKHSK